MLDSISPVTRTLLIATLVFSFAPKLGLFPSKEHIIFVNIPEIIKSRPWSIVTTFFVYPQIPNLFGLVHRIYGLYTHSQALEVSYFMNISQYLYYLFFNMTFMILSTFYFTDQIYWLMEPSFYFCLNYTYAMCFWDDNTKFFGLIPMKVRYTILIEILFNLILYPNQYLITGLGFLGIMSAYVYNCLATQSWGSTYGFIKHRILNIKEPQFINETSYTLKGEKKVTKVVNPNFGQKSEKRIRAYGFGGGKPLYPDWFKKTLNTSYSTIKFKTHGKVNVGGEKLGSSIKIEKKPIDDKNSNVKQSVANHWANKY